MDRAPADALVAAAARHGVSAWVADALSSAATGLPGSAQARLMADARVQIAHGLRIKRLSLAVLDALSAEGICPVLLKGPGLAQRLFPEQPLARPSSDVDVLVASSELAAARRAMAVLGLSEQVDVSLDDVFEDHHHIAFARQGSLVEVHFRLFSGFGGNTFDDRAIRQRLVDGVFEGRRVRWLSPGDEFVYLATHAANHAFLRASWLLDLRRFLTVYPSLDWPSLGAQCRQAHFHAAVSASLWVLEASLGVALPAAALAAFPVGRRRRALSFAFSATRLEAADLSAHRVGGFAMRVLLVDSAGDGLRHVVQGARRLARQLRERERNA